MEKLGYVDGRTIALEFRWAEGDPARLRELAGGLARDGVDVIVAGGDAAIQAALHATSKIPIVMATSGDAVGAGFVASLARPGGNVTGMTAMAPELSAKRLELLKQALPRSMRVAVLWSPSDRVHALDLAQLQAAAQTLGMAVQPVGVRGTNDFDAALTELALAPIDALVVLHNGLMRAQRDRILQFAAQRRVPAIYETAEYTDAGGLIAYGVSHAELFGRSARHVDRILRGAHPADLPVEQPTRLELVVNLKTAAGLGVTIPRSVVLRADRVIE